jgi:hypothetical protein
VGGASTKGKKEKNERFVATKEKADKREVDTRTTIKSRISAISFMFFMGINGVEANGED